MMPYLFFTELVTIERPSVYQDPRNNTVKDWDNLEFSHEMKASVQPGDSQEDHQARDGVEIQHTVILPTGIDIAHGDRVRYSGQSYEVYGAPENWTTGILDHIEARLVWFEG